MAAECARVRLRVRALLASVGSRGSAARSCEAQDDGPTTRGLASTVPKDETSLLGMAVRR